MGYLTDAASVMKASARLLQTDCSQDEPFFNTLLNITCVVHGLHNVAESARRHYKKADFVIMGTKSVFAKALKRRKQLKEECPNLKPPPMPVVTRWGSWIEANEWFSSNENRKQLVQGLMKIRDSEIPHKRQLQLLKLQEEKLEKQTQKIEQQISSTQLQEQQQLNKQQQQQHQKLLQDYQNQMQRSIQQQSVLQQQRRMMECQQQQTQQHTHSNQSKRASTKTQQQAQEGDAKANWEKQYAVLLMFDELILSIQDEETIAEFEFINENLSCVKEHIKKLETDALPTRKAIEYLDRVETAINSVDNMPQTIHRRFREK